MKHILFGTLVAILFFSTLTIFGQKHSVKIGTDIPLQYAIGYDYQISQRFSTGIKFGVLTTPYDEILLGLFELFGANENVIEVIKNGYEYGLILELGGNYHFGKNHLIGLSGQFIDLRSSQARAEAIETMLGIDFSDLPGPIQDAAPDDIYSVKSNLYQLVVRYGWTKQLKNPRFKIRPEVSLSINLSSYTQVQSDEYDISDIQDDVNDFMKTFYHHYGYIPTFGVYFVYTFGKQPGN